MNSPPAKPVVTKRVVPRSGYTTSSGAIVDPSTFRHKVVDKNTTGNQQHTPNTPTKVDHSTPSFAPKTVGQTTLVKSFGEDATVVVDSQGGSGYFKKGLDELNKRQVLAGTIAHELGAGGAVGRPVTVQMQHEGIDHGVGTVQATPHTLLRRVGFDQDISSFKDWRGAVANGDEQGRSQYWQRVYDLMKGGGMDIAFSDYITGNYKRDWDNLHVGRNAEGKEKMVGTGGTIDFFEQPDDKDSSSIKRAGAAWDHMLQPPIDVASCSKEFIDGITNKSSQIAHIVNNSELHADDKKGILQRLENVKNALGKNGKLTGTELKELIQRQEKPEDEPEPALHPIAAQFMMMNGTLPLPEKKKVGTVGHMEIYNELTDSRRNQAEIQHTTQLMAGHLAEAFTKFPILKDCGFDRFNVYASRHPANPNGWMLTNLKDRDLDCWNARYSGTSKQVFNHEIGHIIGEKMFGKDGYPPEWNSFTAKTGNVSKYAEKHKNLPGEDFADSFGMFLQGDEGTVKLYNEHKEKYNYLHKLCTSLGQRK